MSQELSKTYEAKNSETKWYKFWEENHLFQANPHSNKPRYCIVMPPPNVTGVLHMGHALVNVLQDILIRWKRMLGYEVLWIPGTDHAGIATQTVVERHLVKTFGKKRVDYSREEFLSHVWSWKEMSEKKIIEQIKRLGSSCDWSKLRFTMDEGNNLAVRTMFKKLFDADLIYRGDYLVNWDTITGTALADDEVEYEERSTFLWHIKYPLTDGSGFITIATTRPETMLGDTAVAVSPSDPRYAGLIGKHITLPITNREIPIISDHHVDPAFGSGAVKITPAHDRNDYQIALCHNLPFINIMTPSGHINENGGKFQGLSMEEARKAVVETLKVQGFLEKIVPHIQRVGLSYRSRAVIEPYLSKQWFVRMDGFAKKLKETVTEGKTALFPPQWESTYFHWIDNLHDWCISRQLWWGHRIPIWYRIDDPNQMICYDAEGIPKEVENDPENWIQDSDVLDTWFSSALWPFSTLGWPKKTAELAAFYPNSTLVTGHDILFFWVARMLAMGEFAMGEVPFPECFLHGLIYGKSYWRTDTDGTITYIPDQERLEYDLGKPIPSDVTSKWEKMSKSKGNILDPVEMIDQYGTDALRLALAAGATQGRQIDLDRRRFEEFRTFANKIWNGARFVLLNLEGNQEQGTTALTPSQFSEGLDLSLITLEDDWILSKLSHTVASVNEKFASYEFDAATLEAYDFFWKEFCAYYVEIVKPTLFGKIGSPEERTNKQKLLVIVLCQAIRLLHPIAPFITEELFGILKQRLQSAEASPNADLYTIECIDALHSTACMVAPFPLVIQPPSPFVEAAFTTIEQVVYTIRNIRGEMKLAPGIATDVYIIGKENDPDLHLIQNQLSIITSLVRINQIFIGPEAPTIEFVSIGSFHSLKIILPLPKELQEQEASRLAKEKEKNKLAAGKLRSQLSNPDFIAKAPPTLIEKLRSQLSHLEAS